MNKRDLVEIRRAVPEDVSFIFSSWLKGLYYGNDWFEEIEKDNFMKTYHEVIQALLSKPGVQVLVACLKEDPNVILSYSVIEKDKLHWVFTKKAWRNIGLARDLIPHTVKQVTHLTQVGKSIKRRKEWVFNPFI